MPSVMTMADFGVVMGKVRITSSLYVDLKWMTVLWMSAKGDIYEANCLTLLGTTLNSCVRKAKPDKIIRV